MPGFLMRDDKRRKRSIFEHRGSICSGTCAERITIAGGRSSGCAGLSRTAGARLLARLLPSKNGSPMLERSTPTGYEPQLLIYLGKSQHYESRSGCSLLFKQFERNGRIRCEKSAITVTITKRQSREQGAKKPWDLLVQIGSLDGLGALIASVDTMPCTD